MKQHGYHTSYQLELNQDYDSKNRIAWRISKYYNEICKRDRESFC